MRSLRIALLTLSVFLLGASCTGSPFESLTSFPMQKVTLRTADGVSIVGSYVRPDSSQSAVLFLHMIPATKESWNSLAQELAGRGVASLAIDLRGHGESIHRGDDVLDYTTFDNVSHQQSIHDVDVAVQYLHDQGFTDSRIALVGASIGANLALQYLAAHPEIPKAVLMSPGLDYHGVETEQYAVSLKEGQSFLTLASREDEYAFESSRRLYEVASVEKDIGEYENIGHGTSMSDADKEVFNRVVDWIVEHLSGGD